MSKRGWGIAAGAAVAGGALAWLAREIPRAMGGDALAGERGRRVRHSPQWRDGQFRNTIPTLSMPSNGAKLLHDAVLGGQRRHPSQPVPLVRADPAADAAGLHITWYGHASSLVEIEGARILLDPIWSERCSPTQHVGPKRLHEPPVSLASLPPLDAVVISHDHYDHLDMSTIEALVRLQDAPFVVPLGVGAHLEAWDVPAERIIELDWNDEVTLGGVRLICSAARHFSGRGLKRDGTLWASWVLRSANRRVFYTGDSGYFDGYAEIGRRHGPFDAALVQVGAYGDAWPHIHMFPEEGVAAHLDVQGGVMIPVHWATFNLAFHAWSEPVERVWAEAKARDVRLAVPRPGQRLDVDAPPPVDPWWQDVA
ncbi:MBL fold metallo-hydrolase [Hamadaea tsunoensis]|uniref:MBL fold metallo-hydrolase n=1 Tax=Hamadaea tsunoensis TaxID=53368 RepID=UPI00048583BC|nr:MBL fold metallo-hydrolase [Hamadaea tsunoensis]